MKGIKGFRGYTLSSIPKKLQGVKMSNEELHITRSEPDEMSIPLTDAECKTIFTLLSALRRRNAKKLDRVKLVTKRSDKLCKETEELTYLMWKIEHRNGNRYY